ncbi:MAG: hypothetical protein HYU53_05265 [Acidobacteria bacterium]|nr:hypothetical protein [Acidobacteriota bacterium]
MLMGLDRASLSLRLVRLLLNITPYGAKQRFMATDLALGPVACTSLLVPNVDDYYQVLHAVFSRGFDPVERARDEHLLFLESHLRLSSAAQIKPVADLLVALQISSPEWNRLVFAFAQDLQSLTADDRTFSDNTMADLAAVINLARVAEDRGVSSASLLAALRGYLIRHASSKRCKDSLERPTTLSKVTLPIVNAALAAASGGVQPPPITERDIEFSGLTEAVDEPGYWRSDSARTLHLDATELRFPDQREITNRQSNLWRQRLHEFLAKLRAWNGSDETSPNDYWNEKAILFESLLSITLTDSDRSALLQEWCAFMNDWYLNTTDVSEWLYRLRHLLQSTTDSQFGGATDGSCVALANPALSLYRHVGGLAGP